MVRVHLAHHTANNPQAHKSEARAKETQNGAALLGISFGNLSISGSPELNFAILADGSRIRIVNLFSGLYANAYFEAFDS